MTDSHHLVTARFGLLRRSMENPLGALREIARLACLATVALSLAGVSPVESAAQTRIDGLGSLSFPNSGAAEAQHDFVRGVLLLHSFEYDYAADAFRKAQEIDPDFALAYWGEAMTYTHPVWDEKDTEAARAALARYAPTPEARQAKAPTAREKGYLRAIDVLYGDGQKQRLDTLYAVEMEKLAGTFTDDHEARAFYALALLGLSQGNRDVPTYMRAGAIALDLLDKNPDHPGAAHYVIHSFDDPTHAPLAMEAAQLYGPTAPDAAHAQHMTTHIFLALGMWDDVVEANIRADAVVDRNLAARDMPPTDCGHYNEWLMYGYQQQGRMADAEALLMGCFATTEDARVPTPVQQRAAFSYTYMRNLYLADSRDGDSRPATTTFEGDLPPVARISQAWGSGLSAVLRGDVAEAKDHFRTMTSAATSVEPSYMSPYVPVWQGTLDAYIEMADGNLDAALAAAHDAAEYEASLPVDFGPPIAFKPARELEADLLMELGRSNEAMSSYDMALARTPNRVQSLLGYARAAVAAGEDAVAADAYAALTELLRDADGDVTAAAEARRYPGVGGGS